MQGAGQQPVEPLCVPTPALAPFYDRQFPYEEHGVVSRTQIHALIPFIYLLFYFRGRVIQRRRELGGRGTSSSASVSRCPGMAGAGPRPGTRDSTQVSHVGGRSPSAGTAPSQTAGVSSQSQVLQGRRRASLFPNCVSPFLFLFLKFIYLKARVTERERERD